MIEYFRSHMQIVHHMLQQSSPSGLLPSRLTAQSPTMQRHYRHSSQNRMSCTANSDIWFNMTILTPIGWILHIHRHTSISWTAYHM
jgi:hypothetical protein